jgi:protein tyrosine kinase modulator
MLTAVTAGDVYRALWRHRFLIVVLTSVVVGATWFATSRQGKRYEASTLVRIQERGPNAGDASAALQASATLAQTYAQIIDSGALKRQIRKVIPGEDLSSIDLSAQQVQDLDLLSITAQGASARRVALVANAVPGALSSFARTSGAKTEQIVIVKAAASSLVSRHLSLNLAIALMVGFIFNGALALVIELFRDRLADPEDLGQTIGYPVLATVPTLRFQRGPKQLEGEGTSLDPVEAIGRYHGSDPRPNRK